MLLLQNYHQGSIPLLHTYILPLSSKCIVSLHTHSVWETICDARASRVLHGKICAHFAKNTNSHFDYPRIPLPPRKLKFDHKLALWVLTTKEYPHPINLNLALWVLTIQEYPPPHHLENLNLARSCHFEFWLPKKHPLPPKIEIWSEVAGLQLACVETNRCIPQGYCLVVMVNFY